MVSVSVTSRRATAAFLAAIALLVLQRVHSQGQDAFVSSSYGTDFYIGFMHNVGGKSQYTTLQLVIGTTAESVKYVVETNNTVQMGTVSSGTPVVVTISSDEDLQVTDSDFDNRKKGVHVYTTGNEPIFVLAENYITEINYGTYLAYPCIKTENNTDKYEYYVISTDDVSDIIHSQFLLVGCEDDTTITIMPTQSVRIPQDPQMETSMSVTVDSFTMSHSIMLHQMQTLLISSIDDLTGTKIVSNKPLTVISGHGCANIPPSSLACEPLSIHIPQSTNGTKFLLVPFASKDGEQLFKLVPPSSFACESLSIHVPPSFTWGTKFLLAPFTGKDGEQLFKLVSAEPTTVVYTCGMSSHRNESVTNLQIRTKEYCYLESSKPLLVAQFSNEEDKGDLAIAMISPIDQYVSEITFFSLPTVSFPFNYISVTVSAEHYEPKSILRNGKAIECDWKEIWNHVKEIIGYGCSMEVSSGSDSPIEHMISHMDVDGLISVLVYGFNEVPGRGYAYLAGQKVTAAPTSTEPLFTTEPPTPTEVQTTTNAPEALEAVTTTRAPPTREPQECPPNCTFEYCNNRNTRTSACTVQDPQSTCDVHCTITNCRACYYADEHRSPPGNCKPITCSTYPKMDDYCLERWSICVRRADAYPRMRGEQRTAERFKCYEHPCL